MSVMKDSATQQLIAHIKSALAVGKIAEIDSALSTTSKNPVQNKVITEAIEDVNAYKSGDKIKIYGLYPCTIDVYDNMNMVQFWVAIPLSKIVPKNVGIDDTKTSGSFSVSTDGGYIKIDNANAKNISFASGNHNKNFIGYDLDSLLLIIEIPMSSVTYQDGTAISGDGKVGFININANFEFE